MKEPARLLSDSGIKPTPNRILVLKALVSATTPMSLLELESHIGTLERSSILRVLNLFMEEHLIHNLEDGRGIEKYEICHGEQNCSVDDMHPHFYCERCNKVYCFEELGIPAVPLPPAFKVKSVNLMYKGLCPACVEAVPAK